MFRVDESLVMGSVLNDPSTVPAGSRNGGERSTRTIYSTMSQRLRPLVSPSCSFALPTVNGFPSTTVIPSPATPLQAPCSNARSNYRAALWIGRCTSVHSCCRFCDCAVLWISRTSHPCRRGRASPTTSSILGADSNIRRLHHLRHSSPR